MKSVIAKTDSFPWQYENNQQLAHILYAVTWSSFLQLKLANDFIKIDAKIFFKSDKIFYFKLKLCLLFTTRLIEDLKDGHCNFYNANFLIKLTFRC